MSDKAQQATKDAEDKEAAENLAIALNDAEARGAKFYADDPFCCWDSAWIGKYEVIQLGGVWSVRTR